MHTPMMKPVFSASVESVTPALLKIKLHTNNHKQPQRPQKQTDIINSSSIECKRTHNQPNEDPNRFSHTRGKPTNQTEQGSNSLCSQTLTYCRALAVASAPTKLRMYGVKSPGFIMAGVILAAFIQTSPCSPYHIAPNIQPATPAATICPRDMATAETRKNERQEGKKERGQEGAASGRGVVVGIS